MRNDDLSPLADRVAEWKEQFRLWCRAAQAGLAIDRDAAISAFRHDFPRKDAFWQSTERGQILDAIREGQFGRAAEIFKGAIRC